ncbi:MAG: 50S ribosome-binding GTPase [Rhodopseudomonas palustris]|nr:50S ribosome-binding GTPase [Rhodopseudomonas palustris]
MAAPHLRCGRHRWRYAARPRDRPQTPRQRQTCLPCRQQGGQRRARGADELAELGFDPLFPIAAIHGLGVEPLIAAATKDFVSAGITESASPTRLAIVGRPNVGKSSLINSILQSERTIVSEILGTTRDSVDAPFTLDGKPYILVDTAGLRHKRKIASSVDQFGLMRAERSIRECDMAVLVLDAMDGVTKQDKKIAGQIFEANRACVVLVNKWTLLRKKNGGQKHFARSICRPCARNCSFSTGHRPCSCRRRQGKVFRICSGR